MERIVYQKTLDVHKNGVQFTLSGFETADNLARRIEISLTASGDAIDFPIEKIMAVMYVNVPGTDGPSVIECEIKDNTVVYDVLPVVNEGITEMQLKLIEIEPEGAKRVLATPKFAIEVSKSNTAEEGAVQTTAFTALENALAKAKAVYDSRFLRMELSSDCMFRAFYADGTVFESDMLRELFHKGESVLSQSYARGDTGIRIGEKTDNSMYYSRVAKGASIEVKENKKDAQEILDEVRQHGVYTVFKVNFETGEVDYISPRYNFKINTEDGNLEAISQSIILEDEIGLIVTDWLVKNKVDIKELLDRYGENLEEIGKKAYKTDVYTKIETLSDNTKTALGLTSADTPDTAFTVLLEKTQIPWNVDENVGQINAFSEKLSANASSVTTGTQVTANKLITMINSGNIYLYMGDLYKQSAAVLERITIYINDNEIISYETLDYNNDILTPLAVVKGDILKIALTVSGQYGTSSNCEIGSINLLANMNTTYKYITLTEGTGVNTTDVLNDVIGTLLGVTE